MAHRKQDRKDAARHGLLQRVIGFRRARDEEAAAAVAAENREAPAGDGERLLRLEARIEHLEAELEALQDSVHREAARRDERIAELQEQLKPHAIAQALSAHARERGI